MAGHTNYRRTGANMRRQFAEVSYISTEGGDPYRSVAAFEPASWRAGIVEYVERR